INTEQLKRNPFHIFTNVYGALRDVQVAAGTSVANSAAKLLMPAQAKKRVYEQTEHLIAMAPELRVQLRKLSDPALKGSIGSLLVVLNKAVQLWRLRNPHALSSSIKTGTTSKARYIQGKGELEVRKKEVPAQKTANPVKNGPCVGSCNSILFSLGAETFSHTDFSLPGPFPIDWTRTYYSRLSAYDQGALGARWLTEFTTRFDLHDKGLVFHDSDGREHKYALKPVGQAHYDAIENLTLVRVTENTLLLCRGFERKESYVRHGDCFLLAQIELRNGAGVMLHHEYRHADQPVLSDLITYQGDLDNV
ncbi:RHS repeat protein, partial [Pseudomonas lundensis]